LKSVKIIVQGIVQGVFFRQSTQEKARSLNLNGTVRNCNDGAVEIFAEGDSGRVDELVEWCKSGPPHARVTKIVKEEIAARKFTDFRIIR
jgi:acylphosphatase